MTPVSRATIDVVDRLEAAGEAYLEVCQLMPNCPLRTAEDVVASHRQFTERPAEAQISVARYGWQSPWWAMRRAADGSLDPLFPDAMRRAQPGPSRALLPHGSRLVGQDGRPASRGDVPPCRQDRLGDRLDACDRHRHRGRLAAGRRADGAWVSTLALYTAVYPAAAPFLDAWYASVQAQADRDFDLWISLDGLTEAAVVAQLGIGRPRPSSSPNRGSRPPRCASRRWPGSPTATTRWSSSTATTSCTRIASPRHVRGWTAPTWRPAVCAWSTRPDSPSV